MNYLSLALLLIAALEIGGWLIPKKSPSETFTYDNVIAPSCPWGVACRYHGATNTVEILPVGYEKIEACPTGGGYICRYDPATDTVEILPAN